MKNIKLFMLENSIKISGKDLKIKRDDLELLYIILKNTGTKDTSDFRSKLKLKKAVEDLFGAELHEPYVELKLEIVEFKTLDKIMDDYKTRVLKEGKTIGDDVMHLIIQIEEAEQIDGN